MTTPFSYERLYQVLIGIKEGSSFTIHATIESRHHLEMKVSEEIPNRGSSLNVCELHLFNIGEENISLISSKNLSVIVKAGYMFEEGLTLTPDDMQVVYEGDLINVHHNHTGTDVVTSLICQEGHHQAVKAVLDAPLYIKEGTSAVSVLKKLLSYIPYSSEIRFEGMDTYTFQKDVTLTGQLIVALDEVCTKISQPDEGRVITWMFHRGKLLVLDRRPKLSSARSITHKLFRSHIKGVVELGFDERSVTPQIVGVGISEVTVRSFLKPAIEIGDNILIESARPKYYDNETITGDQEFAVVGITTKLSYEGSDWDSIIKARIKE